MQKEIYAKIVEKCGDRIYEEQWIEGIDNACKTISTRIQSLLKQNTKINKEFQDYYSGLRSSINEGIKEEEAISMISEHLITRPAFDKIFEDYKFSESNPVSKTMKKVLDQLDNYGFRDELKDFERFYEGISRRMDGIDNSAGRQKVIKELYESFIKKAFPKTAEKLGVAFTPIEVVDFILESVNEILKKEFQRGLTDKGVHIIDPFVGTGTFINRLISNEYLIKKEDLQRKFKDELHANEILLLPYYVASINIEEAYNNRMGGRYKQFSGIILTDTFNINEQKDNVIAFFHENKERIKRQKSSPIQVIIGNPPYSSGQKSANDANKNTKHLLLERKIKETYVKESKAQRKGGLYDSYIKAIRWATDRLGDKGGIIGFIHNASLVNEGSTEGLRKSLVKEFDSIYCFNLRGNQRTKGELSKKEGGQIFGKSSRTPVAITFLVKSSQNQREKAEIKYYDIGDYLSREEKLKKIKDFRSIDGINYLDAWKDITPDKYGDWIDKRDDSFDDFLPIGDKKKKDPDAIFNLYSLGVSTSRDSWAYNFSQKEVHKNMKNMIGFYNQELIRLQNERVDLSQYDDNTIDQLLNRDNKKISWSRSLKKYLLKRNILQFDKNSIRISSYRPFMKSYFYFDRKLNETVYQIPKIFPQNDTKNKVICISGIGAKVFSTLMTDVIPNYNFIVPTQCFPLYQFDKSGSTKEAISDSTLNKFREHYLNESTKEIKKEDIFYYIYGILHSNDYREKYKFNLNKSLPRIPLAPRFWDFSKSGRKLAYFHIKYESQIPPEGIRIHNQGKEVSLDSLTTEDVKVKKIKMRKDDKTRIQFNDHITISNIPEKAWDYQITGCPAIKFIMDRYQCKVDKGTNLINDPNSYSEESSYIIKLLLSIMTVSLETQKLIHSLPSIDFDKLKTDAELEKKMREIEKIETREEEKKVTTRPLHRNFAF